MMKRGKICPVCKKDIGQEADVCPFCGFDQMNRIFLSKKDYEDWQKEKRSSQEKPKKETRLDGGQIKEDVLPPLFLEREQTIVKSWFGRPEVEHENVKVIAGARHGLILTGEGKLYGIGENDTGQIADSDRRSYTTPHLIADHVLSAAASLNYTLYISKNGQVYLQGRGVYKDRFKGFEGAVRVEASKDHGDVFYLQNKEGQWLAFGDNEDGHLTGQVEKMAFYWPNCKVQTVRYFYSGKGEILPKTFQPYTGRSFYTGHFSVHGELTDARNQLLFQVSRHERYQDLRKRLGEKNLRMEITQLDSRLKKEADQQTLNGCWDYLMDRRYDNRGYPWDRNALYAKEYEESYSIALYYECRQIYDPIPCKVKEEKREWPWMFQEIPMADKYGERYLICIEEGKFLWVAEKKIKEYMGRQLTKPLIRINSKSSKTFLRKVWKDVRNDKYSWMLFDVPIAFELSL